MSSSNAARVQGAGPNCTDGDPILVCVASMPPPSGCVQVEDCPTGTPVRVNIVQTIPVPVTDNGGSLTVDDGGGSLTVDGSVAVTNFPASQAVNDGGGSLTVDDGGGSLTVDGTVAISNFPASQAITIADGADVAEGATTDAANTTGTTGTISGKLRGLVQLIAAATDVGNSRFRVFIQNATLAVTQSGSWLVDANVKALDLAAVSQYIRKLTLNDYFAGLVGVNEPGLLTQAQLIAMRDATGGPSGMGGDRFDQVDQSYLISHNGIYVANLDVRQGTTNVFPRMIVQRNVDTFKTVTTAAAGNTALWTPAAGKSFRLMRYKIMVTGNASFAVAAVIIISLFDAAAGATGQVHSTYIPAVAAIVTGENYDSGWIDLGNGYPSVAANNVLNVNLSAALATGACRVICCGMEE